MTAITMRQVAQEVGLPYSTFKLWCKEGFIQKQEHTGIKGKPVRLIEKQMRELRILVQLRGVLDNHQMKIALRYLREDLTQNPLSVGRFFVVGGLPQSRRLLKICDTQEAIEFICENRGLTVVPLLFNETENVKERIEAKNYVALVHAVSPKEPIFTAKEWKDMIDHVQNEAKHHPCKRTKTDELVVLLMVRGLSPIELRKLKIEDLPCFHHEHKIIVYSRLNKRREVYLYDSLETKINEYVQKYRKDAKREELLFVSAHGNRISSGVISCKITGKKRPGRSPINVGLGQKVGIKRLISSTMFKRTAQFQLAGKHHDKSKSKPIEATLKQFFERCFRPKPPKKDIEYYKEILFEANKRGRIPLYPLNPREKGKGGQAYTFSLVGLIRLWPKYKAILGDVLPDLCQEAINKDRPLRDELYNIESEKP